MLWLIGDVCLEQPRETMHPFSYTLAISVAAEIHIILEGWLGLNVTPSTGRQQDSQAGRPPHRGHLLKVDKLHV